MTDINILTQRFVPVEFVAVVRERLAAFIKRAVKKGIPTPAMRLTGETETRRTCDRLMDMPCRSDNHDLSCVTETWVEVVIEGEVPKYAGWRLVASVDNIGGRPVFRTVPDETIPDRFKSMDPSYCEHCNINRFRNETHIVGHDDGRYMQMGSTCIKDYLGWDVSSLTNFWSFIHDSLDDEDGGGYEQYIRPEWTPAAVIMAASQVVSVDGRYYKAEFERDNTKGKVMDMLTPPTSEYLRKMHAHYSTQPEQAQRVYDETMKAWAMVTPQELNRSEWLYNISILMDAKYITSKHVGILCSIVTMGLRAIQDVAERPVVKDKPVESQHIGRVGDKIDINVTVTDVRFVDSDWGGSWLITMQDEHANIIKWFSSNEVFHHLPDVYKTNDDVVGHIFSLRGSIKKHEEYKGKKSTVVTRAKLTEVK